MNIKEKMEKDFKQALKDRDELLVSTLRMLKSAIHNMEIERRSNDLSSEEIIKIIKKQALQHQDSIEQFQKGKREDLVEKETKELEILKRYLPKQLSEGEIAAVVKRIITEADVQDKADFGKIMKLSMAEFQGKADGKLVSQIVSAQLKEK